MVAMRSLYCLHVAVVLYYIILYYFQLQRYYFKVQIYYFKIQIYYFKVQGCYERWSKCQNAYARGRIVFFGPNVVQMNTCQQRIKDFEQFCIPKFWVPRNHARRAGS